MCLLLLVLVLFFRPWTVESLECAYTKMLVPQCCFTSHTFLNDSCTPGGFGGKTLLSQRFYDALQYKVVVKNLLQCLFRISIYIFRQTSTGHILQACRISKAYAESSSRLVKCRDMLPCISASFRAVEWMQHACGMSSAAL